MAQERSSLHAAARASAGVYPLLKFVFEWSCSLILLVPSSLLVVGLAIPLKRTSEGPVLYSQVRVGRFGRPFRIYKLRTMTHGCERGTGPVWASADDPRVTRLGRWLRDTHLDELPQLLNVLRGDMGLIGPRPERPEIASQIRCRLPAYRDRLLVRPGITGLAQMRLPPDSDMDAVGLKLSHDLRYIDRMSPALDARIALSTLLHFLGWAAMAASRRLVQPHAPERSTGRPVVVTRSGLTPPERRIEDRRAGAHESSSSMAA